MCSGGARITTHCDTAFDLWGGSTDTVATGDTIGTAGITKEELTATAVQRLCAEVVAEHQEVHMLFLCQHMASDTRLGTHGGAHDSGAALNMAGVEAALR